MMLLVILFAMMVVPGLRDKYTIDPCILQCSVLVQTMTLVDDHPDEVH